MGEDNKKLFRKSFRGFRKGDVYSYIEKINTQYAQDLENEKNNTVKEQEKYSALVEDHSLIRKELDACSEKLLTAEVELMKTKCEKTDLETKLADTEKELAESVAELGEAKTDLESLRARLAEAESEAVLKDNRLAELESVDKKPDPFAAYDESAKIIKSAKIDAAVIIAKAEREAGFIALRSQKQKQIVSRIIEEELTAIINEYVDDYSGRTNDIFSALSVEYKSLYVKNAEIHEQLVRSRASLTERAKDRIIKTIESISFDDEDNTNK